MKLFLSSCVIFLSFCFYQCKNENRKLHQNDEILATYKGDFLMKSEVESMFTPNLSDKDSIELLHAIIEKWIKKKIWLNKAENSLSEEELHELDGKIATYKQDLIINAYNQKIINENFDSVVNDREILSYYGKYKKSFPVNQPMLQFEWFKIDRTLYDNDSTFLTGFFDFSSQKIDSLEKNSVLEYHSKKWESVDYVNKFARIDSDKNTDWYPGKKLKFTDENKVYWLKVDKTLKMGEILPYDFVKQIIKNLIINKRKLNLLDSLENNLYLNSKKQKEINVYE